MQGAPLYMPTTIGPKQRHSALLTTIVHPRPRRRPPALSPSFGWERCGSLLLREWLWCRVGLTARHFTTHLMYYYCTAASSRLTTTT